MVASPEYACQLVFVMNDTAVFSASAKGTLGRCCGFSGSQACVSICTSVSTPPARLKASSAPR